jgi:hypothetical protein
VRARLSSTIALAIVVLASGTLAAGCSDDGPRRASPTRTPFSPPPEPPSLTPPAPEPAPTPTPGTTPAPVPSSPYLPSAPAADYPSLEAAGTRTLFNLETPDRGPVIRDVTLPDAATLRFTEHGHCEVVMTELACGPVARAETAATWRVGRGDRVIVAEHLDGERETIFVEKSADGGVQMVELTEGIVRWSRVSTDGESFNARERNGANAWPGCGRVRVTARSGGLATAWRCEQWHGGPMQDIDGVVGRTAVRDRHGLPTEWRAYDADDQPIAAQTGEHRERIVRDTAGRIKRARYFDLADRPVLAASSGCHGTDRDHDARGRRKRTTCVGVDGRPAPSADEVITSTSSFDARGCEIGTVYEGALGGADRHGVHEVHRDVDGACEALVARCLDSAGALTPCSPGEPLETRYIRDEAGETIVARHYDAQGAPTIDGHYRVFEIRWLRDALGNVRATSCHDTDGAPVECGGMGFHRETAEIDDAGNPVRMEYFDTRGKAATNLGTKARVSVLDAYDHVVEIRAEVEAPPYGPQPVTTQQFVYDARHALFGMMQFGADGAPMELYGCYAGRTCPDTAWHAVRVIRTDRGEPRSNRFFDRHGTAIHDVDCRSDPCWQ